MLRDSTLLPLGRGVTANHVEALVPEEEVCSSPTVEQDILRLDLRGWVILLSRISLHLHLPVYLTRC